MTVNVVKMKTYEEWGNKINPYLLNVAVLFIKLCP